MENEKEPTASTALAQLRATFLSLDYEEQRKLWDVLVALRGSDSNNNDELKSGTTAIIRAAVFGPEAGEAIQEHSFVEFEDSERFVNARNTVKVGSNFGETPHHFLEHSERAFNALGLSWSSNNGLIKAY